MERNSKANGNRIDQRVALLNEQPDKPYLIRYRIDHGRYGKDDAGEGDGLTQDLIVVSCITHPNGAYSQVWYGVDGENGGPLDHRDVFKAWILIAAELRNKPDLSPAQREFLNQMFEAWRGAVLGAAV